MARSNKTAPNRAGTNRSALTERALRQLDDLRVHHPADYLEMLDLIALAVARSEWKRRRKKTRTRV